MRTFSLMGAALASTLTIVSPVAEPAAATAHPDYTGTFTSMYYNEEGGDLLGDEIRIVSTRKGYQGTLQMAQGEPSGLMLFEPVFDGDRVTFSVADPFNGQPLTFEGQIDARGLRGRFLDKDGKARWTIDLKRGTGYWEGGGAAPH